MHFPHIYGPQCTLPSENDVQQHEDLEIVAGNHWVAHLDSKSLFSTANTVANSTLSAQEGHFYPNQECTFPYVILEYTCAQAPPLQEPGNEAGHAGDLR